MKHYIQYNGIMDWFETCDDGMLELVNGDQIMPSDMDPLLSCDALPQLYDFVLPATGRAMSYVVTTPATVTPYGNYYRVTSKGVITLLA